MATGRYGADSGDAWIREPAPVGTLVNKGFAPFFEKIYILSEKTLYMRGKMIIIVYGIMVRRGGITAGSPRADQSTRSDGPALETGTALSSTDIAERDGGKLP